MSEDDASYRTLVDLLRSEAAGCQACTLSNCDGGAQYVFRKERETKDAESL